MLTKKIHSEKIIMTNEEKSIIKEFLIKDAPILFLGAGFSRYSKNTSGELLPMGNQLKEMIYSHFIEANDFFSVEDANEIKDYNLRDLCETIDTILKKKSELRAFIIDIFSDAHPQPFHLNLTAFPWKKIYTVNIDNLVERIFRVQKKSLTVQNQERKKEVNKDSTELTKLHGCVNAKDEDIVFSSSDYLNLMNGSLKYRLNDLIIDLQNNSFVFIGASLDEPDIEYYLSVYERAGYDMGRGKILCVSPKPSFTVKRKINALNGIIIDATTEEFLNYVKNINYNPTELEKSKNRLAYAGIHNYGTIIDSLETGVYESRLYHGYESNWRDLREKWIIVCPAYYDLIKKIDLLSFGARNVYCIALYGKRLSGKACLLKLLSSYLSMKGYEVLIYNGKEFDKDKLFDYISLSPSSSFALMIENAAYYYPEIEKCLKSYTGEKRLLFVTSSREYYHFKKRYYLEDNPYEEYEIIDKLTPDYALTIHKKLMEKGMLGWVSRDEATGQRDILRQKNLVDLLSRITFGVGFVDRISVDVETISSKNSIFNLYVGLAIFDKADLEYYPKELLNNKILIMFKKDDNGYSLGQRNDQGAYVVDYISYSDKGITIKNHILIERIWKKASKEMKISCLLDVLKEIAPYVYENRNSYWKIIFECLLKEEWLEKEIQLTNNEMLKLFYQLKDEYSDISYYWLQLGITEQRNKNYDKAKVHLDMALKIRPHAYQIQHAIARNYLRHANSTDNEILSKELFEIGKEGIIRLIESDEYYKRKARDYSIHCYISESIRFLNRFNMVPSKEETRRMKKYIDLMNPNDPYYESLIRSFTGFVKANRAIEYITMKQQDAVLHNLFYNEEEYEENDIIVDAYQ